MADRLADLVHRIRPKWQRDAACREHPELTWFPTTGEDHRPAVAVCSRCLVRAECLAYARSLGPEGEHGIYGGLTGTQRRRERQAAA